MIWLYRLIFWPFLILMLPGYLLRLARRGGRWHLAERFGNINPPEKPANKRRIWIQAVSVGELVALKPLLEHLRANEELDIVLSTTTTTGYRYAEEKYKSLVSFLFTFPLDPFSGIVWKKLKPNFSILMESELWPEHLQQAHNHGVRVGLINARLSDRSYRRFSRFSKYFRWIVRRLYVVLAATKQDAERFIALGANPELVSVTGNLKFDAQAAAALAQTERNSLLASLGWSADNEILLGSSTWPGEEAMLINIFGELSSRFPKLRLLITPRHAERGNEVEDLLRQKAIPYHRRSKGVSSTDCPIVLADTTGELAKLTQLAKVVVVGKSFNPHTEGQSPIDAAAHGKPTYMGLGMSNFAAIAAGFVHSGGACWAAGQSDLKEQLLSLLGNQAEIQKRGQLAKNWFEQNRGATRRTLEWLELYNPKTQNARTTL